MKLRRFQSYPGGSAMGGGVPCHQAAVLAVDVAWVGDFGSRAQRRRIARELSRRKPAAKNMKAKGRKT